MTVDEGVTRLWAAQEIEDEFLRLTRYQQVLNEIAATAAVREASREKVTR